MVRDSRLYREIMEQPEVVARFLHESRAAVEGLAAAARARGVAHVLIAARGTSDNAGRYAQYVLGAHNRLPVALAAPSLFSQYGRPPRLVDTLVLGISQSGKSPDIVAVLAEARRQGQLTAALTNAPDSELARTAEHVIPLHAGEELAVAATKTYTAELAAVAALSAALVEEAAERAALRAALERMPAAMAETLALDAEVAQIAPRYRYMTRCVAIGRGFNYATAFELALKLKELTYTVVEPYSSADFLHGPLALIEPGFPVIAIAPSGALSAEQQEFLRTLRGRRAELIVIGDDAAMLALARVPLRLLRPVPEWLSPLTAILPGQLLALHLAHTRDFDVDAPRGIRKVTETR